MSDRPAFTHRRERHGLIGPFSGRQLGLGAAAVLVAVLVLIGITTPLGSTGNAGLPYTIPTAPTPCSDTNHTVVVQVQVQVDYWIPSYLPVFGSSATVTGEASMPCLQ